MRNSDVYLQLYIIRHAESMGNVASKEEYDPVNPPLTAKGFEQAKALGKRLASFKFDALYSSPLQRAKSTALEIAKRLGNEIIFDDRLIERETAIVDSKFVGISDDEALCAERAKKFIDEIKKKDYGKKVIAVSHAEFSQFLIRESLGISDDVKFLFCAHNASITKINFREEKPAKLAVQNDISHLAGIDGDMLERM